MATKVFEYGCLPPDVNAEMVGQQILLAHRYRNRLVEIELERRRAVRAVLSSRPEVGQLEEQITAMATRLEEVRGEIRAARQKARARVDTAALDAEAKALRQDLKVNRDALRAAKKAVLEDHAIQAAIKAANEASYAAIRAARAASALYWGTYLIVEQAADKAAKEKMDPHFKPFTGDGRIAVQLQGGLAVEDLFGTATRLQVDPVATEAWTSPVRGERRRLSRTRLRIRIGSEGRAPIWAEFPMIMHRPLPEGGRIKWAWVIRERIATHYRWRVQFVVDLAEEPAQRDGLAVGIDLGWRRVEGGLRVAYWHGEDGQHDQLILPDRLLGAFRKVEDLRSIRDKNFNAARDTLLQWLAGHEVPDWLRERTQHLGQWRATKRLAAFVLAWRDQRFDGDEEIFAALEAWRRQDRHLLDWEGFQRTKAIRHRREIYRVFAARLARAYAHAALEDMDLRQFAKLPEAEEADGDAAALVNRTVASISVLRLALEQAVSAQGGSIHKQEPVDTTRTCHACGSVEHVDFAPQVWHTCSSCGAQWDQDHNAAINLMRQVKRLASGPVM